MVLLFIFPHAGLVMSFPHLLDQLLFVHDLYTFQTMLHLSPASLSIPLQSSAFLSAPLCDVEGVSGTCIRLPSLTRSPMWPLVLVAKFFLPQMHRAAQQHCSPRRLWLLLESTTLDRSKMVLTDALSNICSLGMRSWSLPCESLSLLWHLATAPGRHSAPHLWPIGKL